MAEENDRSSSPGARRFRLPKLFAETDESLEEFGAAPEGEYQGSMMPSASAAEVLEGAAAPGATGAASVRPAREVDPPSQEGSSGDEGVILEYVAGMAQELLSLRDKLSSIADQVGELNSRESSQEKVFDTLHAELSGYKKDFIYEHLKPVVRPLLFLYDSLEQFDAEVGQFEIPAAEEKRTLSPILVRQNVSFFLDQLVEALRVCEVMMMETPSGVFNAKTQKAVGVEAVESERDNHVVRVVRSGWYLNGQMLRPAEVVVGKASK